MLKVFSNFIPIRKFGEIRHSVKRFDNVNVSNYLALCDFLKEDVFKIKFLFLPLLKILISHVLCGCHMRFTYYDI